MHWLIACPTPKQQFELANCVNHPIEPGSWPNACVPLKQGRSSESTQVIDLCFYPNKPNTRLPQTTEQQCTQTGCRVQMNNARSPRSSMQDLQDRQCTPATSQLVVLALQLAGTRALAGCVLGLPIVAALFAAGMTACMVLELGMGTAANRILAVDLERIMSEVAVLALWIAALGWPMRVFQQVCWCEAPVVVFHNVLRFSSMIACCFLSGTVGEGWDQTFLVLQSRTKQHNDVSGVEQKVGCRRARNLPWVRFVPAFWRAAMRKCEKSCVVQHVQTNSTARLHLPLRPLPLWPLPWWRPLPWWQPLPFLLSNAMLSMQPDPLQLTCLAQRQSR